MVIMRCENKNCGMTPLKLYKFKKDGKLYCKPCLYKKIQQEKERLEKERVKHHEKEKWNLGIKKQEATKFLEKHEIFTYTS